jgi:hypothetical protein
MLNEQRFQPLIDVIAQASRDRTDHLKDFAKIAVIIVCVIEGIVMIILLYFFIENEWSYASCFNVINVF